MNGDPNNYWNDENGLPRPKRTSGSGPWSALRFSMRVQSIPKFVNAKPGVVVIIIIPILFYLSSFIFQNI